MAQEEPVLFPLPPRVGIAFNMVNMLKEITTEYESKSPRDMTQHEKGCYQTCLDTIRQYVNGEMVYSDTVEPTPAAPKLKTEPQNPFKRRLGTTANASPFIL